MRCQTCHSPTTSTSQITLLFSIFILVSQINWTNLNHLNFTLSGGIRVYENLETLDLRHNGLTSLEDMRSHLQGSKENTVQLFLGHNKLQCHCSLSWIQHSDADAVKIVDHEDVECEGADIKSVDLSEPGWCRPYILPLFRDKETVEMGHNISWSCRWAFQTIISTLSKFYRVSQKTLLRFN